MSRQQNNFDLVRLVASFQVMVLHTLHGLAVDLSPPMQVVEQLLRWFPGVPTFFVISGFLISASFERCTNVWQYALNRLLRIYPALLACTVLTLIAFLALGRYGQLDGTVMAQLARWLLAQLTLFQFYIPEPLKAAYGLGHWNGSLWTIPVELEFYAAVPLIYLGIRRFGRQATWMIAALLFLSFAASLTLGFGKALLGTRWELAFAVWRTSVPPYLYMFLLGVLAQRYWSVMAPWLTGRALAWLLAYLAACLGLNWLAGVEPGGNNPHALLMLLLAGLTLSAAHTAPMLANRILAGNDISYGVYIYHMVVVNLLWEVGLRHTADAEVGAITLTCVLAIASWVLVERPALRMKRRRAGHIVPGA